MSDVIDMTAERNRREGPDADLVTKDGYGRPVFTFALSFDMEDGSEMCADIVAYSEEHAEAKVAAMRKSLRLDGNVFSRARV